MFWEILILLVVMAVVFGAQHVGATRRGAWLEDVAAQLGGELVATEDPRLGQRVVVVDEGLGAALTFGVCRHVLAKQYLYFSHATFTVSCTRRLSSRYRLDPDMKTLFDRGTKEQATGDAEYDRLFEVRTTDPSWACRLIADSLAMRRSQAELGLSFELSGPKLEVYMSHPASIEDLRRLRDWVVELVGALERTPTVLEANQAGQGSLMLSEANPEAGAVTLVGAPDAE